MPEKVKIKEPEGKIIATSMNFHVPKLQKAKLATELKAHPIDFTQTRKDFKDWFTKTMRFSYSFNPESGKLEISNVSLEPNIDAIFKVPDGGNLFLYLDKIPKGVTGEEFNAFLSLYQPVFKMLALEERVRIFADDGPDQQERFADWESRSILLEIMHLKDARKMIFSPEIQSRMDKLPENVIAPEYIRQNRIVWSKRRPGIGMLFTNNIVAREYPEYDLPYLNELLCYHDSLLFQTLINNSKKIPKVWGLWVAAHSELLSDTTSETHKLFCAIFHIPEGKLFDDDGSIRQEAGLVIPPDLYDGLAMVERRKQKSVTSKLEIEANKQRVVEILSGPLQISCDGDFIIDYQDIPTEMEIITITIKRNDKTYARTSFRPSEEVNIDLKERTFETFPSNPKNPPATWEQISHWKGGDTYTIEVQRKIGSQESRSQVIRSWKPERIREIPISPIIPIVRKQVAHIVTTPPKSMVVLRSSSPIIPSKAPKDTIESQKEDLETALELFLDKPDQELQTFFLDHHLWDEEKHTLTLAVPIKELQEMGYVPNEELFPKNEYNAMLQWTAKLEERSWIMAKGTPPNIRETIPAIYGYLARQAQEQKDMTRVGEIDAELGELGLQPSLRNTETLIAELGKTCKRKPINTARLTAKIKELGILDICLSTRPTANMLGMLERRFRCYNNATSITLAERLGDTKKNKWILTYNWETQEFSTQGLDDELYIERLKNALVRFLLRIDEEMVEEMLLPNIRTLDRTKSAKLDLEKGLRGRLEKGKASLFIRRHGKDIIIPDVSGENYEAKIAEIQARYGKQWQIYIVYRTYSYAFIDGQYRDGQEQTYNHCIESDLELVQARCRATLAEKNYFRENSSPGNDTAQERGPFTNGVADLCRKFFLKKDPFSPNDMHEFLEFIHAEGTMEEKSEILLLGVINALFSDTKTSDIDSCKCREFFFERDPNSLKDIAVFLAFLEERGTDQINRPGEKHVGIVYNSPVIGLTSDIQRILAQGKKEKKKKD